MLDEVLGLTTSRASSGGAPRLGQRGRRRAPARNYAAMIDQPYQFESTTRGLDCLPLVWTRSKSKGPSQCQPGFGDRIIGPEASSNQQKRRKDSRASTGTFTAGEERHSCVTARRGLAREWAPGQFVGRGEQVTFSGTFARARGQRVLYVTERAVFRLGDAGSSSSRRRPDRTSRRDIPSAHDVRAAVAKELRTMDRRLFIAEPMGIATDLLGKPPSARVPASAALPEDRHENDPFRDGARGSPRSSATPSQQVSSPQTSRASRAGRKRVMLPLM